MRLYQPLDITEYGTIREHFLPQARALLSARQHYITEQQREWLSAILAQDLARIFPHDMTVRVGVLFAQEPGEQQAIHVDGFQRDRMGSSDWALNIPLSGSGLMTWYQGQYTLEELEASGLKYLGPRWHQAPSVLDQVWVDQPMLVRISQPHSVSNPRSESRMILSLRFAADLQWR